MTPNETIELALMMAELELDGIKTHIDLKRNCHLKGTDIEKKVKRALSGVRSARDLHRASQGSKQWTLTTRGGSNRHPELDWDFNIRKKNWQCVCEKALTTS